MSSVGNWVKLDITYKVKMWNINGPLPEEITTGSYLENKTEYIRSNLAKDLPRSDAKDLDKELKWQFILDKIQSQNKKAKKIRKKKTFLTRKERLKLNLLKLPKTDWNYESYVKINEMWTEYMSKNLELANNHVPDCTQPEWANFSKILAKSELIGAKIRIVRSKIANQVGMEGIVVLETKQTFQIVTKTSKLKILLKTESVFEICWKSVKLTIFGKHLVTRPNERSVKKIKMRMSADL